MANMLLHEMYLAFAFSLLVCRSLAYDVAVWVPSKGIGAAVMV